MNALQTRGKAKSKGVQRSDTAVAGNGSWGTPGVSHSSNARLGAFYSFGPVFSLGGPVQAKESISETGDIYEQEASAGAEPAQLENQSKHDESTSEQTQQTTSESPVQAKCAACDAEDESAETEPVQLWDCREYTEPTCVQTQQATTESPVQAKCAACEAEEPVQHAEGQARSPRMIQREARQGLRGAGQPLPHADRIQAAFGRHDVSRVRTSVGGDARIANHRMGALAFTSGDRIGFRDAPSLHLAAHEAAHVVQQREGLSLPDNVGRAGDRWEQHADRVADAVVAGRSAEALLSEVAQPDTPSSGGVARGGDSALAASVPAVQQQITSYASRLFEPPLAGSEVTEPVTEGAEAPEAGPEAAEPAVPREEEPALEAAKEGESEAPLEGAPATGGALMPAAGTPVKAGSGGGISARCYSTAPEDRPADAPAPTSDKRGSEPEEQPQVTFEPWPAEADECPAEKAVAEGSQQMPEGIGAGKGSSTGVALAKAVGPRSGALTRAKAPTGGVPSGSREVQAISRAATTGADEIMASASNMDSETGSAVGERDAAVSDYLASTEGLGGVVARARSLEAGVTFPSANSSQQFVAREAAIAQTQDFMARAADQISAAVAFAQEEVPDRLGSLAEAAKANIQDAMEIEKVAISGRIAQARAQGRAGAAAARAHVNTKYASSVAVIEAATRAAITALDAKHETSIDLVDEKETTGLDDVNSRFATGRTEHEAKGPEYANLAIARGQEHAAAYEQCKGNYSDDGFWDGCLTVRRAKAQQDAACKTAASYKDVFLRTANKKGHDLVALRRQYRCAVIAGAREVNQTLDATHDQLVSGLQSGRTQALEDIALARDESLSAIDNALAATLKSLSAQEYSQRQAVNDTGYLKQLAVEQLAHTSAANLARGISAAMDSLERALTTLSERFAQGDIPEPASLERSLAVTEAALGGGVGTLLDTMREGAQQAEGRIEELGAVALEALALLTATNDDLSAQAESGFAQQVSSLKTGASNVFEQLTENHFQQAEGATTDGTASMDGAVAGFDDALATIGGRIDEAIASSLQELDQQLKDKLGELDGQIAREAWKAAEKEQPAWKSVVAIVLIIVVIIAAAVISIVTLGAGASLFAVILVGALVGAVSGGLIQLINNWASGEAWHTGLAQAMIMGAIGGAIGGGLGFAGGALAAGAAAGGARAVTQLAITLGSDLVAEGLTQSFGYVAFGQEFNWQGFVMAGAMSGVSFRAHPGGAGAAVPRTAGAAGGRRAAVAQIAGGAALGLGIEYTTAKISGQEFDAAKAASAAASAAVGARMSRRAGAAGPTSEPTTRLGRATERLRTFDPGGVGARLETRLQGLGSRASGARPEAGAATRETPTTEQPTARRTTEPETTRARALDEPAAIARPQPDEPEGALSRGPISKETAADLAGPANRMKDQDLIDTTTTRSRVGDIEHDFYINRQGSGVCSDGCGPTIQRLTQMINSPDTPKALRTKLMLLRAEVGQVKTRMQNGEQGFEMIRESGRIAERFRQLGEEHPSLGRRIDKPELRRLQETGGATRTSPHLEALGVEVVRTKRITEMRRSEWADINLKPGEDVVYIVRDVSTEPHAVLKVGCAGPTCGGSGSLGRFGQYRTAANRLGLRLEIDVAVVKTKRGGSVTEAESTLRTRLENEGQVMPWDATRGRLGREHGVGPSALGARGIPFVYAKGVPFRSNKFGNLVSIPETVAVMLHQGKPIQEIADYLAAQPGTVLRWINRPSSASKRTGWRDEIQVARNSLEKH